MNRGAWQGSQRVGHDLATNSNNGLPRLLSGKDPLTMEETQDTWVLSLGLEDPLE